LYAFHSAELLRFPVDALAVSSLPIVVVVPQRTRGSSREGPATPRL